MSQGKMVPDKYFPKGMIEKPSKVVTIRRYVLQFLLAAFSAAFIGYFSANPKIHHVGADEAIIKMSVAHVGDRKEKCVKRTKEELQKLAPNMRAAMNCSRERLPVLLELEVDGKVLYSHLSQPKGLSNDGESLFYHRVVVKAGEHKITMRMRDSHRTEGFDYENTEVFNLVPGQNLAVRFDGVAGKFNFF